MLMHTHGDTTEKNTIPSTFRERATFFFVMMGVITITYGLFYAVDFLPEKPGDTPSEVESTETTDTNELPALTAEDAHAPLPLRIVFDTLDREVKVLNPTEHSVEALDTALLSGVVRHPDSADFSAPGTIFLFGHSSYLPNVQNKNFQAFNGIQKLVWGDTIRLYSADTEYVYQVDRVYEASATNAEVKIEKGVAKLTLVTCDSFGAKTDRFVVEATLVRSLPLETTKGT